MKSPLTMLVMGLMIIGIGGCMDDRPVYVEPKVEPAKTVELKGAWGTYIEEIDCCRVESAFFQSPFFGFNDVMARPGRHHLVLYTELNSMEVKTWFTIRIAPGKRYEFSAVSLFDHHIQATDLDTHLSVVIPLKPKREEESISAFMPNIGGSD